MSVALGVAERLLALEKAVAELRTQMREALAAAGGGGASAPEETGEEPSAIERLAGRLGNGRLAAVLARGGYTSPEAVAVAPDEALLAIDGVGEKALRLIREKLA